MNPTAPRYLKKTDFADHLGVSRSYVTQLGKNGLLVMQGRMVNVAETESLIQQQADPSKQGVKDRHAAARNGQTNGLAVAGQEITEKTNLSYQKGRAVKEHYNALTAKMDYEKAVGKLLLAEDVIFIAADSAMVLRNRLEAMPDSLDPQLEAERDPERRRVIFMDYIENLLTELSRRFKKMAQSAENQTIPVEDD